MKKIYYIILIWTFSVINVSAQELQINVDNKALNEVLIEIRDKYALNLSFDDYELSKYKITLNQHFQSPELAFNFMLNSFPIEFEKSNGVYLFYPKKTILAKPVVYFISGKINDAENRENLPFTHVLINGVGSITDEHGNFTFKSKTDSIFHLKISHLGYRIHDTTLYHALNYQIGLSSSLVTISEVTVTGNPIVFSKQTGSKAGFMRINHKIAHLIPGNGDNSVFNLLRLQPGVLAAGEQSSEMIIWGSYEGQSRVNFDGITLFGLKNYNDNISTVNPYMAKDIRIHKGGFDATLGERVGGIIDITGIDGNRQNAGLNLNINNMTMNIMGETPLGSSASIVGAFRQTYYNLYSPDDIRLSQKSISHIMGNSIVVNPDYIFRDGNLKFSGQTRSGDSYHISSFWGQDNFSYSIEQKSSNGTGTISQELNENNLQYGAIAHYNKIWVGKGSSKLSIAYSGLQSETSDKQNSVGMNMNHNIHSKDELISNDITELKASLSSKIRVSSSHELEFGSEFIRNSTLLKEDSFTIKTIDQFDVGTQIMGYLQDEFSIIRQMSFTYGVRADYSLNLQRGYFQPRLNIAIKPYPEIQFNASWGLYNQFVVLSSIVDQNNNYSYQWMVSDNEKIPVLEAQHFILGGVYHKKGFSLSLESFYKETKGITRLINNEIQSIRYTGKSKTMGLDFFIKQEYIGHSAWISYSLSKTLEWFPFFQTSDYERALHDQRHEFKLAGIINLSPFYISANYVYGTGFIQNTNFADELEVEYPYSRIDIAGTYRFSIKKMKLEVGLSILNILNRNNIKYNDFIQIPTDENNTIGVYTEAVPFTPSIFINISL